MKRQDFLKLAGTAAAGSLAAPVSLVSAAWASAVGSTRVTVKIYELKLRQAWGLSRGTWTTRVNAFVRVERDGIAGLGEAAPIARYNETAQSAAAFIDKAGLRQLHFAHGCLEVCAATHDIKPPLTGKRAYQVVINDIGA